MACWAHFRRKFYECRTTAPTHEAARLVPAPVTAAKPVTKGAVGELKQFRDEHGPLLRPGESVQDLVEEGRR